MKISFFAKIGMLLVALAGVLYFMQSLDSGKISQKLMDPNSSVGLLLGSEERVMNWCPKETSEIELYSDDGSLQKTLTTAVDISSLCEIMVGSFSDEETHGKSYSKRLVAKTKAGDAKVLEQIPENPIFRVQGLPFKSPMLLKNIANLGNP